MEDITKRITLERVVYKDVLNDDGKVVDMKVETESRSYLMIMNINVLDHIRNKYKSDDKDGLDVWTEKTKSSDTEEQYKALSDFMLTCLNEGIRIENKGRKERNLQPLEDLTIDDMNFDFSTMLDTTADLVEKSIGNVKN